MENEWHCWVESMKQGNLIYEDWECYCGKFHRMVVPVLVISATGYGCYWTSLGVIWD